MNKNKKRIAIVVGAGFVPAINAVVQGAGWAGRLQAFVMVLKDC
jgi:hypothetical protein